MYQKYSDRNSWKFSPLSSSEVGLPDTASMKLHALQEMKRVAENPYIFLFYFIYIFFCLFSLRQKKEASKPM